MFFVERRRLELCVSTSVWCRYLLRMRAQLNSNAISCSHYPIRSLSLRELIIDI